MKPTKKKILVTASTFPRWEHDTEPRFVLDLCKAMSDAFDITVLVPASPGAADEEILEGVHVVRYHYFPVHRWETLCYPGAIVPRIREKKIRALLVPFLFLGLYRTLGRMLPDYDIVHAHWLIPQGIVQSFYKTPYIVTGHGGDVMSLNNDIMKRLKRRCLLRARHVTVVSEALKKKVLEIAPEIDPAVISMGVDTSKFGPQYRRENLFGQGDKKVVLFVGRLAEIKGVTYLIEAMKDVDAMCVIVGDGPLRKQLMAQADADGMRRSGKIKFLGPRTHEELRVIYASADIFVLPSVTASDGAQEGMPTVLLEAMASGLPVVASNVGGVSHVIYDKENGLLLNEQFIVSELKQAINKLQIDSSLIEDIKRNSLRTSRNLDYRMIASEFMKHI